jgi:hypothetical protein
MRLPGPLDPATYARHPLHAGDRAWPESNCYVDLWVELLHAYGLEPVAALPFAFAIDVEGDQWTFFKFPPADLDALYGVEVFELNVWRPLVTHLEEQLALDRPAIVDVDAFYLPDTAGTTYRTGHVKTSIAVHSLDRAAGRLGYFHNAGYYTLDGLDFGGVLGLDCAERGHLPPYVEVAKFRVRAPLRGQDLVAASLDLLRGRLARRPHSNPFRRYAARLAADLGSLADGPLTEFHGYAFATFRQYGAAFELGGAYLRWLQANGEHGLDGVASACDVIATTAKTLQLKTARLVNAKRTFDPAPLVETMAGAWDETMACLAARYGASPSHHEQGRGLT